MWPYNGNTPESRWPRVRKQLPLFLSFFLSFFLFFLPHFRPPVLCAALVLCCLPSVANSTLIHKVGNTTLWARSLVVLSTLWMTALYIQSSSAVRRLVPLLLAPLLSGCTCFSSCSVPWHSPKNKQKKPPTNWQASPRCVLTSVWTRFSVKQYNQKSAQFLICLDDIYISFNVSWAMQ